MGDAYERLTAIAEAQLRLGEEGAYGQLSELEERAEAIVATLPKRPPGSARPALARAAAAQDRLVQRLSTDLAEARSELERLRRGRDAARSYGATANARALPT